MSRSTNVIHAKNEFGPLRRMGRYAEPSWLVRAIDLLLLWQERAHARRHLAELPDNILKDVGITRSRANDEARKPFWKE